ncbi:MAG TPA: DNA polymerase I [Ruminiclostridium sp.]|nr:DNA polymerase I [Ruminiclostridium sp.]
MKLLVIDGNSILNRAFYGIKLLSTRDGIFTNGIYGFINILNKLLDETKPQSVAVAFDLAAPTFRHTEFDGYKAGRKPMPDELHMQMPILKELLDKMGYTRLEAEGFEADDILGTQAAACERRGDECVIATGDRDSLQLVSEKTIVLLAGTKGGRPETTVYDVNKIHEVYGVEPKQLIEVKALMGDTSDRIPGVAGVGEKTALKLIQSYKTLKEIYDNLDGLDIRDSLRKKLADGRDSAFMSHDLAEIHTDAPVETDINKLKIGVPDNAGLYELLRRLEFFKLIEKMGLQKEPDVVAAVSSEETVPVKIALDGEKLLSRLKKDGEACFSAIIDGEVVALSFAFDSEAVVALPDKTEGYDDFVKAFLSDNNIKKRTHDIKPLISACLKSGYGLCGAAFDTMLAGYVLDPLSNSYEPSRLCGKLGVNPLRTDCPFGLIEDVVCSVNIAAAVRCLYPVMCEKIEENGQNHLYYDVELPLAAVLAQMETLGFRVDAKGIKNYGDALEAKLDDIEKNIFEYTGYEFNINSPKQLGTALFEKLGLPAKKKTKTGYSTNAEVLESLRSFHPIIELLLDFRQLSKLKSTYTDGLLKVIDCDGRIHSNFNQVETRTGRISSTEPNLQNIPVRSEAGKELRRFFIPEDGSVLVDADYSQIELRILAHIADDSAMIDAFNNKVDIHTLTASQVFKMPLDMVTPLMRSRAKAVNFGIVYGIGAFSLSQDIGVSVKEADSYIKGYLETFSGVRKYMEQVIESAHGKGFVETLLGRRRDLPELASSNRNLRNFGERVARNTPIQGTAADVIKIAMIRVHDRLEKEGMKSRLILQVHDELIVEAPKEEAERAGIILREEMEGAMNLKVKLEADVHSGDTWYSAKG